MRRLRTAACALAGLAGLVTLTHCHYGAGTSPWDGIGVGSVLDLRLVADYDPTGPYRWWEIAGTSTRCEARDGLRAGVVVRLRLIGYEAPFVVPDFIARPLSGVVGVDFSGEIRAQTGAVIGAQVPLGAGFWRLTTYRHASLDSSPLGEVARPGEYPPIRVIRYMSGDVSCMDDWVGELSEVSDVADASTDE